ncbi:HAD family hydrolase [Oscillatoria sp. FACHB-1406]|uniref:HAD family hydrolase n=1 Tax=Oscillatoria sp. FACHB-1406 TaxID=2692846 RepID=UPI001684BBF0|nr:HAD family hydrolase [Oscillatoria sp. FACHB-1406]MBD2576699.1 HAD family hydrolase [Oscillatoria sp. FACHB-1406]
MEQLQALIFDVDGTLADTERDGHRLAFNRAFREADLDWDWPISLYGELLEVAGGKERIRAYLKQYRPDFQIGENLDDFIAKLHARKTKFYQELLAAGEIPLRPGVKRLILEAKSQGVRLAIATTSAYPNAVGLLEKHLDPNWFEVIAAGDIVASKKPAPDIYYYVLEKMGLDAKDCLVFEDSYQGFAAAKTAGLKSIVTVNHYTQHQEFAEALLVVDNLGEPDRPCTAIAGVLETFDKSYLDWQSLVHLHQHGV